MPKKYTLDIDGFIGSWFCSKHYVKKTLADTGSGDVLCRMNSLGGNLDDAIDVAAQFETHGNVTCELFGLNASAATIFTLGAKKVRAHINSSYLIHKVLNWVDKWGYMNEDDIDQAIEELKKEKDRSSTLTLIIARMYAKKSGKPVAEILSLMKEEKWLTAEEAKDWGFVDEVFEDPSVQPADIQSTEITQLINAAGLPLPKIRNQESTVVSKTTINEIISGVTGSIKEYFNPSHKNDFQMNKNYSFINTLLNIEGVEFKNGKMEISESQIRTLNEALTAASQKETDLTQSISDKDTEINDLKTQISNLEKGAGAETTSVKKDTDAGSEPKNDMASITASARELYNALPD